MKSIIAILLIIGVGCAGQTEAVMFEAGTHIQVTRPGYTHHGIVIGPNAVVCCREINRFGRKGRVTVVTLKTFCDGAEPTMYHAADFLRGDAYSKGRIVARALSRVNDDFYHPLFSNCEHFCNWATHGDHYSFQTAGTVENSIRMGNRYQAGGLTLFDLFAVARRAFRW
jgi:hypothetical protein